MDSSLAFFGTVFAAFFAIMNPLANTPVFLGLTGGMEAATVRRIAFRALALAYGIVAVFALSGHLLLSAFGITMEAFRIAGGVLVALVGYHLLQGEHSSVQKPSAAHLKAAAEDDAVLGISVSPLAMPLLAGPGTLVTAMNFAADGPPGHLWILLGAFFLICTITYVCFVSGERLTQILGKNAIMVTSRIMGLILAVVGTQMLIDGIRAAAAPAGN